MKAIRRGVGTRDKPTLVPSAFESRLMGCQCHDDSTHINYIWLHRGPPQRCACGYYYQLVYQPVFEAAKPPCD
ncbi:cytochrome c oxidase subunit 5B, mitochondrial-like [Nilaparvata lugens]|uniref:cytochrome c oxidase subunit 5B, mitochondrial-like n=1 Tax=Nilaparvata lugens TaxID=108931 RepID=UPI00193D5824|nr:cytochrome c oxidase subunit 5B, mitochondrial-like [Nilaparvata lugens]